MTIGARCLRRLSGTAHNYAAGGRSPERLSRNRRQRDLLIAGPTLALHLLELGDCAVELPLNGKDVRELGGMVVKENAKPGYCLFLDSKPCLQISIFLRHILRAD